MVTQPLSATDRPPELSSGDAVGEWIVTHTIATGGFATVYEARHFHDERRVALKLLHAHLVTSSEMLARFDREIAVVGRLKHPSIVELVAAGFSHDGQPFLCMELLDGETLARWIARSGSLAPPAALAVLEPLCDALATAHAVGVVHRDVKAANVNVGPGAPGELGRVVLLDFGIAKITDALAPELTATQQSVGTPSCMAPEQIHGGPATPRTDVYALGALLFHMLTGRQAFDDVSPTMTQYLHLHARRPRASALVAVPERLDDVIVRAMAIEPADRFPDVHALLAAARAAVRDAALQRPIADVAATAILVSAHVLGQSFDEALLTDLESVLPAAERLLVERDFMLGVDLGSTAIFVRPGDDPAEVLAAAVTVWEQLAQRAHRDPRVKIGVCAHRGTAAFAGSEVRSPALLRPTTWQVPDVIEGLWITGAIDPAAPSGKRIR